LVLSSGSPRMRLRKFLNIFILPQIFVVRQDVQNWITPPIRSKS